MPSGILDGDPDFGPMLEEDFLDGECEVCGCTNESPCDPPCFWVELDMCSNCVGEEGA